MAKRKKRVGYGVKPPYIDLGQAIELVDRIYDNGGGSVSEDQLSAIFNNSVESSSFRLKLTALKAFGLVSQAGAGNRIELSELGRSYAGAVRAGQQATALKTAFLNLENYRKLYEFWSGKVLPPEEFFLNSIREECRVPQELVMSWKNSFMDSAKAVGLLQERSDGRVQLRREPGSTEEEPMASVETEGKRGASTLRPVTPTRDEVERFPIPLVAEGKSAIIELPKGWTPADVKKMIHVIEAMFLWQAEGGNTQK
jgi:hypothetical protein